MSTSDGISAKDWDVVHDLAVDIVNAPDQDRPSLRRRLLEYLDGLEVTYGARPSILATRADYLDDEDPRREELLLRAYALAELRDDTKNILDVAHSLAELYLEKKQIADTDRWLHQMRRRLAKNDDPNQTKEYERLRNEYRRLAIVLAPGRKESDDEI